jgi:outer membrane immunogenic protein
MKRTTIAGIVAGVLMTGPAIAADMRDAYKAPIAPRAFNWNGLYLGGNLGYGWANVKTSVAVAGVAVGSGTEDLKGAIGGGQIGYNWQTGAMLVGIEADYQGSGQKATFTGAGITAKDSITSFGTVRGRLGYVSDTWLLYMTGGGAYGTFRSDLTVPGIGTGSSKKSHGAWTIGAGVENAFATHWTWKAEYLFIDTGRFNDSRGLAGVVVNTEVRDHIFRLGVNYLFN